MQSNINSLFSGQKVICIDGNFPVRILEWASNLPQEGGIYTIRSIVSGTCLYTRQAMLGLHLLELRTLEDQLAFRAERFLPLFDIEREAAARLSEMIREVGNAALKSLALRMKSGALHKRTGPCRN